MIKEQSVFHTTKRLCLILGVSSSAYYAWAKKIPSQRKQENEDLSKIIKEQFVKSRHTYGVPRIQQVLRNTGKFHCKARISRIMKQEGLKPKAARRFKVTTNSKHNKPVAENILGRQFRPHCLNKAWASDITYIHTNEGWLYLATVIDLYNRKIVGWSMGTRLVTQLIEDALTMAIRRCKPPKGVIHHSDRGAQYCSDTYQMLLKQHGFICSMSGKGNCYDNAVMESFYHTLKTELLYGEKYKTREETQLLVFDYILLWDIRRQMNFS
ncbi:IS3 family transposase [Legionella longbeachae]|uniref:IS3 family transposase n=1 Tax=Legionella longbeachae TaxID=450 RepID=UPI0009B79225|nr:IS3 family transposase [Legionella longbeachae]ARB93012.1 IS3 family transposase [Legionella longbeachae]VEE04154.1 IS3 element protein InsF [Legionella oakridgensis]